MKPSGIQFVRALALSLALSLTLSLLLPLTLFAAGDWDSYIKDPNYTVISEVGTATYDKSEKKVQLGWGDPIPVSLYKKGQEDGEPLEYQELNAKFSTPQKYLSAIPEGHEDISWQPRTGDGSVAYHADSFERVAQKGRLGSAAGGYSGGLGLGAIESGEAYASVHWSLDYDFQVKIVSEAMWPMEYTLESGGFVMNDPELYENAMYQRADYEERHWSFGETTLAGRRTLVREHHDVDINSDAGTTMVTDRIDLSHVGMGDSANQVPKDKIAGRYNPDTDKWEDWRPVDYDPEQLGLGGKASSGQSATVHYGYTEYNHAYEYAVIDPLPTVSGFYAVILINVYDRYEDFVAPTGRVRSEAASTRADYMNLRDIVVNEVPEDIAGIKMEFAWGKNKIADPVHETVITDAKKETGEDGGTPISNIIVGGDKPDLSLPAALISTLGGAIAAAGLAKLMQEQQEEESSSYVMYINKNFGDELRKDDPPQYVYARIAEITPAGAERDRPDLSEKIRPFSGDGILDVKDAGMTENGYRAAQVAVPQSCTAMEGEVSFEFVGKGGTYTRHVVFQIIDMRIDFAQENMGLPAHMEKEIRLPFDVIGLPEEMEVTAYIKGEKKGKQIYDVKVERNSKWFWRHEAIIRDLLMNDEEEPGTTETYFLHVRAEAEPGAGEGANALKEKKVVEADFPILRIHMGLSLVLEGDAIGCFLRIKEGHEGRGVMRAIGSEAGWNISAACATGLNPMAAAIGGGIETMTKATVTAADPSRATPLTAEDLEPCVTKGKLLLLRYNEEEQQIERVAVYPETTRWENGGKTPICDLGVTILEVENTKNAGGGLTEGIPDPKHQSIADSLKICAFPTNEIDENGARTIRICTTEAALDPPTRMRAELVLKARYAPKETEKPEEYTVKKTVLLHSQPFRTPQNEEEADAYYKWDKHVTETLSSIEFRIEKNYMYHLESLHDMIVRMREGYDRRFGYDYNQLNHVMELWTGFLKGEMPGARGEALKLTLSDDLAAAYAFLQGMRDNGGFIGRFALGICTSGYSEMVFFAMDLGEKMKEAVFACKGDEFGFWDGIKMGVEEYEKQLATEFLFNLGLKGVGKAANFGASWIKGRNVDLGASAMRRYRNFMNGLDSALKSKSKLYRSGSKTLTAVQSFLNVSSEAMADSISRDADLNAKAEARANQKTKTTIAERRMGKGTVKKSELEWQLETDYDLARESGMKKLRELWEAQQNVTKSRGTGDGYWKAKSKYEEVCREVWRDKNALKQLKNFDGAHATNMRIEFNRYRSKVRQRTAEKTLDDIARETGKRREDLYISSATSNSNADELAGKTLPEDWDVTITEVNYSDAKRAASYAVDDPSVPKSLQAASKENIYLVIDQELAQNALARNLHKEVYGFDAATIKEAVAAMKKLDVTYVQPVWTKGQTIEPNLEAYADLAGMIDKSQIGRELKALALNRKTFAYKGDEWYHAADKLLAQSAELVTKARGLTGEAQEKLLKAALGLRLEAVACNVEGTRQITKQVTKIAMPRNNYRVSRGMSDAFSEQAREIHALAKKVGTEIGPDEFFHILRRDYGISKYQYTRMMSECLV